MKFRSLLAATALAAAAAIGSNASAATVGGTIGGAGGGNDYLGSNTLSGYFGGNIALVGGPADIEITVLGFEAGYLNSFNFGSFNYTSTGGTNFTPSNLPAPVTLFNVGSGLLNFWFGTDSGADSVANGSNPDNSSSEVPNFFASFLPNQLQPFGQGVLLFLDDGAGGATDNHDDLIVQLRIVGGTGSLAPVPLPAGGLLLIGALGGLAALRRRKSA